MATWTKEEKNKREKLKTLLSTVRRPQQNEMKTTHTTHEMSNLTNTDFADTHSNKCNDMDSETAELMFSLWNDWVMYLLLLITGSICTFLRHRERFFHRDGSTVLDHNIFLWFVATVSLCAFDLPYDILCVEQTFSEIWGK